MNTIDLQQLGISSEDLVEKIVERISDDFLNVGGRDLHEQVSNRVESAFEARLDEAVEAVMVERSTQSIEEYVAKATFQKTNKWGEKQKDPMTFLEYLDHKANTWLTEKVNYKGQEKAEDSYNFRGSQTRMAFMIHEHFHHDIQNVITEAMKNVNNQMAEGIRETISMKLKSILDQLSVQVKTGRG